MAKLRTTQGVLDTDFNLADGQYLRRVGEEIVGATGGGSGVSDHGELTGLGDDDHAQYHTDGRAVTWHAALPNPHHANANDPSAGQKAALPGTSGTPGDANRYVTNADPRNSDARAPTAHGHAESDVTNLVADLAAKVIVAGQIGGSASLPDVRGVRETGGPTLLALGAVADGQYLRRSGATVVGGIPAGGADPPWYGVLYGARGDCNPVEQCYQENVLAVAGPTPTAITASIARCVQFAPPANITVNCVRLFGVGATTGLYKFAIYPVGTGSSRMLESGAVNSTANAWLNITVGLPVTLNAGTRYWFCVTVTSTGTTAGFRSEAAPLGTAYWGADAAPLGNRSLRLAVLAQFGVAAGAYPATLPAIAAAAYAAGSTGSVPFAWLDNIV